MWLTGLTKNEAASSTSRSAGSGKVPVIALTVTYSLYAPWSFGRLTKPTLVPTPATILALPPPEATTTPLPSLPMASGQRSGLLLRQTP